MKGRSKTRQSQALAGPEARAAMVISDATAPALLGMTARAFRDAVQRQSIPHVRIGARVVVAVEDLREMARTSTTPAPPASGELPANDDGPDTPDAVLALIGRRRVAR